MDRRETDHKWYSSFDAKKMRLIIENNEGEELEIPAKYEVCGTCEGKGSHVNPSIDSHGISPEEFAEDRDFEESYFRGDYDVPCNECHGQRVTPVPDEAQLTPELKAQVEIWQEDFYNTRQIEYMERRMGA